MESVLSCVEGLRRNAESAKMGRKRPHSDTTDCITRSNRAQNSQIPVFFEVPICGLPHSHSGAQIIGNSRPSWIRVRTARTTHPCLPQSDGSVWAANEPPSSERRNNDRGYRTQSVYLHRTQAWVTSSNRSHRTTIKSPACCLSVSLHTPKPKSVSPTLKSVW